MGIIPKKEYTPTPVPQKKLSELGELCLWLYGSKSKHKAPLVKSQNPDLRYLDEALQSKDGEAALRSELGIEVALKISRGENRLLRESLVLAEQTLREVRGLVLDGYEGEEDLIRKSEAIHLLSDRILDEMREMYSSITGKPYRKR